MKEFEKVGKDFCRRFNHKRNVFLFFIIKYDAISFYAEISRERQELEI